MCRSWWRPSAHKATQGLHFLDIINFIQLFYSILSAGLLNDYRRDHWPMKCCWRAKAYSKMTYSMRECVRACGWAHAQTHLSMWYKYKNKSINLTVCNKIDVFIHRHWLLMLLSFYIQFSFVYFWTEQFQSSFQCVLTQFDFNIFSMEQSIIIIFIFISFHFVEDRWMFWLV